jgi:hypothetical protein
VATLNAAIEFLFPTDETKGRPFKKFSAAWTAFFKRDAIHTAKEFDVHQAHEIVTARGPVGPEPKTSEPKAKLATV